MKTPLLLLLLITASLAVAQSDAPILPAYFYGDVTINGVNAPVNTIIYARINGQTKGQITTTLVGQYGDVSSDHKLAIIGKADDLGETIEFFVKKPNTAQLKADQTYTWQSGTLTVLDLTASGEEITEATDITTPPSSSGSSSGGGSSGGGGGGSISIQPQSTPSFRYANLAADQQVSMTPNVGALVRLQIVPNVALSQIQFLFDDPQNVEPSLDNAYTYFSINAPITDDQIDIAIVRFKIPRSYLEGKDIETVALYRLVNGDWEEVSITDEGNDANDHFYRAAINGMGTYGISVENMVQVQPDTTPDTPLALDAQEVEEQNASNNQITGFAAQEQNAPPSTLTMVIGVFVIVLIIAGLYFFTRGD